MKRDPTNNIIQHNPRRHQKLTKAVLLAGAAAAQVKAVRVPLGPKIDGRLDDACWQRPADIDRFWRVAAASALVGAAVPRVHAAEENTIQIALIAKQPIPLARGAVFKKPTIMTTSEGATYEVGEEGTEYLVPEKHLAPFLGRAGLAPAWAWSGGGGSTININSPLIQTAGLSNADLEEAGSRLYAIMQRQARRRGGR